MSRIDYCDFHTLQVDCEKVSDLYLWPSIRRSGLADQFYRCCKQASDHPNELVVLEVEFYVYDPERLEDGE